MLGQLAERISPWSTGRRAGMPRPVRRAVHQVSFTIAPGECVGLVGESGSGKSTLIRMVARLLDPSAGSIHFAGHDTGTVPARHFARRPERARLQLVFRDPGDSLNPSFTAFNAIADPLRRLAPLPDRRSLRAHVEELVALVGLPGELLTRYPHQLSGGQTARVDIARAIGVHPALLVLDEPTFALDVSVQAVILRLLDTLRHQLGMSSLFVSHDLHVVRLLCDRVLVRHRGSLVEEGLTDTLFSHPEHPYTRDLLAAIPFWD